MNGFMESMEDATPGARLKMVLAGSGMTQAELAEHLGVSRVTVARWVADRATPSLANAQRAANLLGVRVGMFLKGGES